MNILEITRPDVTAELGAAFGEVLSNPGCEEMEEGG